MKLPPRIDYAVAPSPTQAAVAGFVVGVGWACAMIPVLAMIVLARSDATRWPLVYAGLALLAAQGLVIGYELVRLLGADFHAPSCRRTLSHILVAIAAATLIGNGVGGTAITISVALLVLMVLMAATIGNNTFIGLVIGACLAVSIGPAIASGTEPTTLTLLALALSTLYLGSAAIVRETRDAGIRAAARFDRLTETTEVILRADAFGEALAKFLPLVAAQVGGHDISVFTQQPGGRRVAHAGLGEHAATDDEVRRFEWAPPDDRANGFETGSLETFAWARGADGRTTVIVVHAGSPGWRQRVPFNAALRQLAPELELMLRHTDLLAQLDHTSRTDPLTGLPNRLQLNERLHNELSRARRGGEPFTVAMIDLDEFKSFNDTFGHLEGDRALAGLGALFLARIRAQDFICRYGGEEFCLLMPATTAEEAVTVLDHLRTLAGALPAARPLSFSAGVAQWHELEDIDQILTRADGALYEAKAAGRHQTVAAPRPRSGSALGIDARLPQP